MSKSGSPKLKAITSFPSAFNSRLILAIASVADSDNLSNLSETFVITFYFMIDKYTCFYVEYRVIFFSKFFVCLNFQILYFNMKQLIFSILFSSFSLICFSQKVYSVEYASQADVKVFVADYESRADLCVYKVKYSSQAGKNDGNWFFVDYSSQSDKKIYFTEYASQADVIIYFVDYSSQAKWKKKEKMHLFY